MAAKPGKKVTISFVCSHENGSLYNFTKTTQLSFVVGQGDLPPSLDAGIVGMTAGEQRTIRLQAKELEEHPLDAVTDAQASRSVGAGRTPGGYEFAPGNDGDIIPPSQPRNRHARQPLPPSAVLIFHVKMVKVEENRNRIGK